MLKIKTDLNILNKLQSANIWSSNSTHTHREMYFSVQELSSFNVVVESNFQIQRQVI